jgi:anaerobic magnesium-protoporphyrin IX monomethyl ester cyclase
VIALDDRVDLNQMATKDPYILLVHPLYGNATNRRIFQPGVELPISLAYLSSYLEQQRVANDILDLRIEKNAKEAVRRHIEARRPLAVGLTASTANIQNAAETASQIKSMDPSITTIVGGWHASALPEETLQSYRQFDYVIHGEGEIALTNLVKRLSEGEDPGDVNGLAFRSDGSVRVNPREQLLSNLDEVPFPALHKVLIARYRPEAGTRNYLRLPSAGICVGRGCPYGCLFCYKGVWGNSIRFRSPENVLEEIELYIKRYNVKDFRFYDDAITFPRWDLKHFCEEIISHRLDISWNCWSRVNDVNEEKLRLMRKAGCYHIKFGIEFGTEKALKLARKGATLEQARTALTLCKQVGIECKGSFIFGIPGETEDDCRKTLDFAIETSPHFATFYPFDPIPGSPFHRQITEGQIDPQRDMIPRAVAEKLADQAYRAFYFRPRFALQRLRSLLLNPRREAVMLASGMSMAGHYWLRRLLGVLRFPGRSVRSEMRANGTAAQCTTASSWTLERAVIRAMDIVLSLAALVLTFPLMVIIGVIIRLNSRGPCLFRQTRIGMDRRTQHRSADNVNWQQNRRETNLGGRPFTFLKFRTMHTDARERYPELYEYNYSSDEIETLVFKIAEDPRLTGFGKHLRMTTLDELPNFINVLKGDMTLVGPRPDIPEMAQYYQPWQRRKTRVKPGITGLAQINGRGLLSFQQTLKCDVEYVDNRSLWMDLKIIAKTITVVVQRIGSY